MPDRVKLAVCECPPDLVPGSPPWTGLCRAVAAERPDLLLLNEMPFGPWIAAGAVFDEARWRESLALHEAGIERLGELGAPVVLGTRPRAVGAKRINEAFVWTPAGLEAVHSKQYFPDEEGFYEARWFEAGDLRFRLAAAGPLRAGFLVCTELMFNEHARRYGRAGAQLLLVPRATGRGSLERWLVATRMAAIVSGAYVASSNRGGVDARGQEFGGSGWIVDPQGDLVARTSAASPVVFHELDLDWVRRAQTEYPCYVKEP